MFDPKWVRDHPELLDRGLKRRGMPDVERKQLLVHIRELDQERREKIALAQAGQEERNRKSKEIGNAKAAKDEKRVTQLLAEMDRLKSDIIKSAEDLAEKADEALNSLLAELPNIPADDVPDGLDASANKERHKHGTPKKYAFKPKQHFDLGEALGLMDFEAAAKLSGSRFVVLKGTLARLERALAQFMLDLHTSEFGYSEVAPPLMVRDAAMFGTAQLPKFAIDQFEIAMGSFEKLMEGVTSRALQRIPIVQAEFKKITGKNMSIEEAIESFFETVKKEMPEYRSRYETEIGLPSRLWLIPTAEVPLTNLVRESVTEESALPMRLAACTPCFRSEAGAAEKDLRGMIRQHQFTKVELVSITTPEQSAAEHERMLTCAETVLKKLDLPFRTMTLCAGDMGFAAQKTYDIEVWLPGEGAYREISSCSNCGEFQARRMQARYRPKGEKQVRPVHTLNGSGVAVGRALIAVLENYQDEGGAIAIPGVLQPYMGGITRIEKTP